MEAEIFSLFDPQNLRRVFESADEQNGRLRRNFARFLAAYFANWPLVCAVEPRVSIPNLFLLAANEEDYTNDENFHVVARRQVAANLPAAFSPPLPVRLLVGCGLWLEACLFVDQFNDLRSALLIRHLTDLSCGLHLLNAFCTEFFVQDTIDGIADISEDSSHHSAAFLGDVADCCTQISVLFDYELADRFAEALIDRIELLSSSFDTQVADEMALPRPPVYEQTASSADFSVESQLWTRIHQLIALQVALLRRTNRLETLVAQTTAHIARLSGGVESEVPSFIEAELPALDAVDFPRFQRLLLVVLRSEARDQWTAAIRRGDSRETIEHLERKFRLLASSSSSYVEERLASWAEAAEQSDFDSALRFFRRIQTEKGVPTERHLPPLSSETLERWQAAFSARRSAGDTRTREESLVELDEKLKVGSMEFGRLDFLATSLTPAPLSDASLVQISLKLRPADFCRMAHPRAVEIVERPLVSDAANFETSHAELRERIRASLRRLGRQALATRAADRRQTPALLDSFNRRLPSSERARDVNHLREVRELATRPSVPPPRSLTARELRSKSPPRRVRTAVVQTDSQPAETPALSDELRQISARLASLRERCKTPEKWPKAEAPAPRPPDGSSGVSSAAESPSPPSSPKRKQKVRKKRTRKHRSATTHQTPPPSSSSCERAEAAVRRFEETRRQLGFEGVPEEQPEVEGEVRPPPAEWSFDFDERSLADERVIQPPNDEEAAMRTHSIEEPNSQEEAVDEIVPQAIPAPLTPASIGRLDFSQLSDREERDPEKTQWSEVEVYEKFPRPQENETKRIAAKAKPKEKPAETKQKSRPLPDWLRLMPLEDRSLSSRLLRLDHSAGRRTTSTGRRTAEKKADVHDSGVIVESPGGISGLAFEMSPAAVKRLIAMSEQ